MTVVLSDNITVLQLNVKEEVRSTAEAQQTEDPLMLEAGSSALALPNGDAHMADALDASCALVEVISPAGAAPAAKQESETEQKPEMHLLEKTPAVKVMLCLLWRPINPMLAGLCVATLKCTRPQPQGEVRGMHAH